MAESKNNYVMYGMSGKLGKLLIFRQRGGKTFATGIPNRSNVFSEPQLEVQEKFKAAASWARQALTDPETRKFYNTIATGGQSAFNMAIADYFSDPEVTKIDATGYTGVQDGIIKVIVENTIKVARLRVEIIDGSGILVEQGDALFDTTNQLWLYTTSSDNTSLQGSTVVATATDKPGNIHSLQIVI